MKNLYAFPLFLIATGCAVSPNWTHPNISDQTIAQRQLVIDDGNCTLIAAGRKPVPQFSPSYSSQVTTFTANGSTFNSATGQRTFNTYSGQATTSPGGGFAGGFASGMANGAALGAMLEAQAAEDRIYKACMYSKGWVDEVVPKTTAAYPALDVKKAKSIILPASPQPVYSSPQLNWEEDTHEFLRFYPAYTERRYHDLLNTRVKKLASEESLSGPRYLVKALEQLQAQGLSALEEKDDPDGLRTLYLRAVSGDPLAQAGMGLAYAQNKDSRTPLNFERSAHWSSMAAIAGNPVGQMGYGLMLFEGLIGPPDRINGYLWVKQAQKSGANVDNTLESFKSQMTLSELNTVE